MSQENVEVVRRALAEVGGYPARIEGSAAFAQLVAPDIEVDLSDVYPDAPVVRGVEGWLRLVEPWGRSLKLQPERFFDVDDDRVLVFMRVTALGEGSGAPV